METKLRYFRVIVCPVDKQRIIMRIWEPTKCKAMLNAYRQCKMIYKQNNIMFQTFSVMKLNTKYEREMKCDVPNVKVNK